MENLLVFVDPGTEKPHHHSTDLIHSPVHAEHLKWLQDYREQIEFSVEKIPFSHSKEWMFEDGNNCLVHRSGKFFSVRGYSQRGSAGENYSQPLIDQPETGTQGFVVRWQESEYELLAQARTEPGNIGVVQIGPTLQATFSNYTAVHGGKRPKFLEWFHQPDQHDAKVIVDTTQPELGSRFLKKWNRNMVIECQRFAEQPDPMFRWIGLSEFASLMLQDHVVNNDARLVFGLLALARGEVLFGEKEDAEAVPVFRSFQSSRSKSFEAFEDLLAWQDRQRKNISAEPEKVALHSLPEWKVDDLEIQRADQGSFSIGQFRVLAADREVGTWDQPLIASSHDAQLTQCYAEIDGQIQFLMHASTQIGNANGAILQPSYCVEDKMDCPMPGFLHSLMAERNQKKVTEISGSDEGGRFFQCVNRYRMIELKNIDAELPQNYCWVTLGQIRKLVAQTDFVSDESRSVLSLILARFYDSIER